jgi:hypothetical protein
MRQSPAPHARPVSSAGLLTGSSQQQQQQQQQQPWYTESTANRHEERHIRPTSTIGMHPRDSEIFDPPRSKSAMAGTNAFGMDPRIDMKTAHKSQMGKASQQYTDISALRNASAAANGISAGLHVPDKPSTAISNKGSNSALKGSESVDTEHDSSGTHKGDHDRKKNTTPASEIRKLEKYAAEVRMCGSVCVCVYLIDEGAYVWQCVCLCVPDR